jgi:hypothetical protein
MLRREGHGSFLMLEYQKSSAAASHLAFGDLT